MFGFDEKHKKERGELHSFLNKMFTIEHQKLPKKAKTERKKKKKKKKKIRRI